MKHYNVHFIIVATTIRRGNIDIEAKSKEDAARIVAEVFDDRDLDSFVEEVVSIGSKIVVDDVEEE